MTSTMRAGVRATARHIFISADEEEASPMTPRRALLVGIDHYKHLPSLSGCVTDARALQKLLANNDDGSPNYDCRLLTSSARTAVTKKVLRFEWTRLFANFAGDVLFYFSGHGTPLEGGGFIATQEGDEADPGLAMDELMTLANQSKASSTLSD